MKNQFFERDSLTPVPWKNGGGITREIASSQEGEAFWRLSIADVTEEGAFSIFPGLHRILTVIEGKGMVLQAENETYHAAPLKPVSFPGVTPLMGKLIEGPVQNFNLIYDAEKLDAEVSIFPSERKSTEPNLYCETALVYCLEGSLAVGEIRLKANKGIISSERLKIRSTNLEEALFIYIKLFRRN